MNKEFIGTLSARNFGNPNETNRTMKFIQTNRSVLFKTVIALLLWKATSLLLALLATRFLPFNTQFTPFISEYARRYPYLVGIWGNFDGMHYLSIARHGYEDLKQGFFPLFPVCIWLIHTVTTLTYIYSALFISHFFFLLTLPFLYILTKKDNQPNWFFFLFVLFLFPTSFFYGAIYNDSLFFFLATSSIFFARKEKWFWASVLAGLATLTRLNGLALAFYLATEYLVSQTSIEESWNFKKVWSNFLKKIQPKELFQSGALWISLVPLSFLSYLAYLQIEFGSWMSLFDSMKIWKQSNPTLPPIVVWRYIKILTINSPNDLNFWVAALELFAVIFYCHIIVTSYKKIRLSYWVFIVVSILIPWCTGTFQGMPRYALHLYPMFLASSLLLATQKKWVQYVYFILAALVMIFVITLFTRGFFVT